MGLSGVIGAYPLKGHNVTVVTAPLALVILSISE
jgi:hypothetical protein